jgi:RNA polymerase sigma factor (sigma-70 family)
VCSNALAIVRDVHASEDVAQESFLAAWRGLRRLRNPASFLPWLRQIARNQAYLWIREHRRGSDDDLALIADSRPSAMDALLADEQHRVLAAVLDDLPEETREVVLLYYREGSSAKHVAALLGLSEDAVKQRLSRARGKMREEMLQRFAVAAARTAPGALFVAGVAGALTTAPAASAAVLVGGGAKAGLLKTFALPAIAGIAGVIVGMKRLEPFLDEREERELKRFRLHSILAVIAGSLIGAIGYRLEPVPPRTMMIVPLIAFFAVIAWLYRVRLPRILARRMESIDPQLRRELMAQEIGQAVGAVALGIVFTFMLVRYLR